MVVEDKTTLRWGLNQPHSCKELLAHFLHSIVSRDMPHSLYLLTPLFVLARENNTAMPGQLQNEDVVPHKTSNIKRNSIKVV